MDKFQKITEAWEEVRDNPELELKSKAIDWLIEEIERLRIIEQAYEGMKKAL